MNRLDDCRLGNTEQIVVALEIRPPVSKALATIGGFIKAMLLDHGSHATVENEDAFAQQGAEAGTDRLAHEFSGIRRTSAAL